MKNFILSVVTALLCVACGNVKELTVTVENPIEVAREGEMVEINMNDVVERLALADTSQVVIIDENGDQVPYQITYDEKLLFPVKVDGCSTATYTVREGSPQTFPTRVFGACFEERDDDVAWENDLVAFRTYGPAFQAKGYRAFGYDVWTKYNTSEPVIEERYATELDSAVNARIDKLRESDPAAANELYRTISYHVDHGNGMDCYNAGPTLGGGTAALRVGNEIIYPNCYATQEILDNGPLRFTVQLTYNPLTVEADSNVVETRIISLDAGSYLNRTSVRYDDLSKVEDVVTGIVLHEPAGKVSANASLGYISYVDPTDNPDGDNGKIFVGAAFPDVVKEAASVYFSEDERRELRGGAYGHVLAISEYQPGSWYTYYWGSAWSKAAIKSAEQWNNYLIDFSTRLKNPLKVTLVAE